MEIWYQSCDWEATSVLNAGMQVFVAVILRRPMLGTQILACDFIMRSNKIMFSCALPEFL